MQLKSLYPLLENHISCLLMLYLTIYVQFHPLYYKFPRLVLELKIHVLPFVWTDEIC